MVVTVLLVPFWLDSSRGGGCTSQPRRERAALPGPLRPAPKTCTNYHPLTKFRYTPYANQFSRLEHHVPRKCADASLFTVHCLSSGFSGYGQERIS